MPRAALKKIEDTEPDIEDDAVDPTVPDQPEEEPKGLFQDARLQELRNANPGDPPWMAYARHEVGLKETSRGPAHDRVNEYLQHTGLDGGDTHIPWCSAFVNWVMDSSGRAGTHNAMARSWCGWGLDTEDNPRVGAIVVISRKGTASEGHVGFLVSWNDDTITLLGGNQSRAVSVARFPRSRVVAMRWPKAWHQSTTNVASLLGTTQTATAGVLDQLPPDSAQQMLGMSHSMVGVMKGVLLVGAAACFAWVLYRQWLRQQKGTH